MRSTLTCPECNHKQKMEIPKTSCQAFYTCNGCGETIKATKGCCIFCDYGDKPCPVAHKFNNK
ncbi:MAG: GDCCVxC domain-containing (seleno)protein [Candidatus Woesearchaeota archaeon]